MTLKQIEKKQAMANLPYTLALQIRTLLDAARKDAGLNAEDWDDVETQAYELAFGEGE